jgi:hypothetical protein
MKGDAEWGYPNPVGYEFGVLLFIHVENWDGFRKTQILWIWVWKGKIRSRPTPLTCLSISHLFQSEKF